MDKILEELPRELRKIIFDFVRFDQELVVARRRLRPVRSRSMMYNLIYFRNWRYLLGRLPPDEPYAWVDTGHGWALIWR